MKKKKITTEKRILIAFFLGVYFFAAPGKEICAAALRSPEDVLVSLFNGWRLQNKTYMTLHSPSIGDLSNVGNMLSTFKVISYSIDWQEKYKEYVIIKTSIKTKSVEKGLKPYYIYWLFKRIDGKWKWEQGYLMGKNATYRNVYWIHKRKQSFLW